jgi:hypothetical protein
VTASYPTSSNIAIAALIKRSRGLGSAICAS